MDDVGDIREFYNRDPQAEHRRLEEHQLEFELTWRYLEAFLPPSGRILEVGAATGRYTLGLARRGYQVTAVDLAPRMIEVGRQQTAEAGLVDHVRYVVGDARDLRVLASERYDAALVMGPLYHLIEEQDRRAVLREVWDLLAPGGLVFTAFISRLGILGDVMRSQPDWILDQEEVQSVLERGRDAETWPKGGFRAYCATIEEVAPLHEGEGFRTLAVAAVEPAISAHDESYNELVEPLRSAWLELLFRIGTEPSMVGASRHFLYVGQKPSSSQSLSNPTNIASPFRNT